MYDLLYPKCKEPRAQVALLLFLSLFVASALPLSHSASCDFRRPSASKPASRSAVLLRVAHEPPSHEESDSKIVIVTRSPCLSVMVVASVELRPARASSARSAAVTPQWWAPSPTAVQAEPLILIEQRRHCGHNLDRPQTAASRLPPAPPSSPNPGQPSLRTNNMPSLRMAQFQSPRAASEPSPRRAARQATRVNALASFASQRSRPLEEAMEAGGERWVMNAMMGRERHATVDAMIDASVVEKPGFARMGPSPMQRVLEINAELGRERAAASQLISRLQQENGGWERLTLELRSELARTEQARAELTEKLRMREAELAQIRSRSAEMDPRPNHATQIDASDPTVQQQSQRRITPRLLIEEHRAEHEQLYRAQEERLRALAATLLQAHSRRWLAMKRTTG